MYLVAAGLGLACRATDSNLPLAAAAAQGELATVRQLLAAGADVDEVDDSGWSAVIRATRQRELSTLTALLEAGADLDRSDTRRGWTPLLHAVHIGALDPARALLAHGAGPNLSASEGGQTPLIMTAGYGAVPMIELLLTHDADPARGGDTDRDVVGGRRRRELRHRPSHPRPVPDRRGQDAVGEGARPSTERGGLGSGRASAGPLE